MPSARTKCEELVIPWRTRLYRLKKWADKSLSKGNAKSCTSKSISHATRHAGWQLDRKEHWIDGHGRSHGRFTTRSTWICNLSLWQRNLTTLAKFNCHQVKGNKLHLSSAPVRFIWSIASNSSRVAWRWSTYSVGESLRDHSLIEMAKGEFHYSLQPCGKAMEKMKPDSSQKCAMLGWEGWTHIATREMLRRH